MLSVAGAQTGVDKELTVTYLTNQLPFPPYSGGQLREAETLRRLCDHAHIDFFAATDHFDRDAAAIADTAAFCRSVTVAEGGACDPDPHAELPDRVRRHWAPRLPAALAAHLRATAVDVVHVEGYFLMGHVPPDVDVPILLVEENIEYTLHRLEQEVLRAPPGGVPWQRTRALELEAWRRASVCGAVTDDDAARIRTAVPGRRVVTLFPGSDHLERELAAERAEATQPPPSPSVLYVGNLSWGPSRDAALYLVHEIWPRIRAAVDDATLVVAGAGSSAELDALAEADDRVVLTGPVPSIAPYVSAADVVICPIRFGGGVKAKLLESVRAGRAVVSSSLGARGIPAPLLEAVVVADGAAALADRTVELL
nr:glycosyltransferase family 4 protein [Actinomycetota bacterium]